MTSKISNIVSASYNKLFFTSNTGTNDLFPRFVLFTKWAITTHTSFYNPFSQLVDTSWYTDKSKQIDSAIILSWSPIEGSYDKGVMNTDTITFSAVPALTNIDYFIIWGFPYNLTNSPTPLYYLDYSITLPANDILEISTNSLKINN